MICMFVNISDYKSYVFILGEVLIDAGVVSVMLVELEPNTRVQATGTSPASPLNLVLTVSMSEELLMGSVALYEGACG